MDATACAWCAELIPPAAAGAFVVHAGGGDLPACSAGCLAALVATLTGAQPDGAEARGGRD